MNAGTASDEAPLGAFAPAAVEKARIPDEGHSQQSPVFKLNGEFVIRHFDVHRAGAQKVTR
jgi:hypothetical protein